VEVLGAGGAEARGALNRVKEEGEGAHKAVGGSARRGRRRISPGHHQRRRLGATEHHLRHGLDREQEEDSAKLTSCSMTAVGWCRRRAAMRGGRDHGCPPGRMLRLRLRAPGRRVLVWRSGRRGRTRGCRGVAHRRRGAPDGRRWHGGGFPWRRRVRRRGEGGGDVGARERTKRAIQSLWGRFYRARTGGEGHGRMQRPLMAMAVAGGFKAFNRGKRLD
jgi:hypothetical protein